MIQIDIEMPEKCGLCPLFHAEHPMHCQGVKADRKKKIVAPYEQPRPDWCPLHEVTDPDTESRQINNETAEWLMGGNDLFNLVRRCYCEANNDYLRKQIQIASEYLTKDQKTELRQKGILV